MHGGGGSDFCRQLPIFFPQIILLLHCEKNIEDSLQDKNQINYKTFKTFVYKNVFLLIILIKDLL